MTRILVIDDMESHLYLAKTLLEPYGYDVTVATGRDSAINALTSSGPFDAILSDVGMPRGNGFEILQEVKSKPGLRDIPFVLISATFWTEADKQKALSLGAAKFIFRPLEARAILTELEDALPPEKRLSNSVRQTQ